MNKERLELMSTMLGEVIAGTWKLTACGATYHGSEITEVTGFNLWWWMANETTHDGDVCGFSACAVGHAMLDERFAEQGLKINSSSPIFIDQAGEVHHNWKGVELFFELGETAAEYLFMNTHYVNSETGEPYDKVSPEQVKWRVDKLLELGEVKFCHLITSSLSEIAELHK